MTCHFPLIKSAETKGVRAPSGEGVVQGVFPGGCQAPPLGRLSWPSWVGSCVPLYGGGDLGGCHVVAHGTVEARLSNNGASVYDRKFARTASTGTLPPPQPHTLLWTKVSDTFASGDTYPQGLDPGFLLWKPKWAQGVWLHSQRCPVCARGRARAMRGHHLLDISLQAQPSWCSQLGFPLWLQHVILLETEVTI